MNFNGKTYNESRRCEQPLAASTAWREAIHQIKRAVKSLVCFATLATTDIFQQDHSSTTNCEIAKIKLPTLNRNNFEIEPFFLEGEHGSLFCIHLYPSTMAAKGGILYLHPFAEEMHKSRRMAALQARAFAAAGYAVLQVDLTGCGDSSGDFSDANWATWLRDAQLAYHWLAVRSKAPITLWGLRIGANLAVELASTLTDIAHLLLWQPVTHGDNFLNQFLRIRTASEMLSSGQAQSSTTSLRAKLSAGENLEVGGYCLSAMMAQDLAHLNLAGMQPDCPVHWLEIGMEAGELLSPASQRIVDIWRQAGVCVQTLTVCGEPFWVTQEITECPSLLDASLP
jgi:exosortase A-associated hydrolase 2